MVVLTIQKIINMIEVIKFNFSKKQEWDSFVDNSKNGTFLFKRDFMDYHSDRFEDFSLMIYRKGKLISCFPANIIGNEIHSHQGLTYGGFVFDSKMKLSIAEEVLEAVIEFYKKNNISILFIKKIPAIYHKEASNEMDYWFWRNDSEIYRRDTTFTVDLTRPTSLSTRKKRNIKKAKSNNYYIKESDDFTDYWNEVLEPNLWNKYNTKPVHSLEEMNKLKLLFSNNIKQLNVYGDNGIVAGSTLFIKGHTIHSQYISSTDEGANSGALDFLFSSLIESFKLEGFSFFDFGISNEDGGKKLNYTLAEYKEGFGAKTYIHEFYKLTI